MRVDTGRLRVVPADLEVGAVGSEGEGPASPGAYIREQRTRRGMSVEQLAAATKIPPRQLERLENDDYADMHGMVFVKGFYRVCARVLRLDEEQVLGLLYEQEREQMRSRRRDVAVTGPAAVVQARNWALPAFLSGARTLTIAVLVIVIAVLVIVAFTLVGATGSAPAS